MSGAHVDSAAGAEPVRSGSAPAGSNATSKRINACALLSSTDIKAVRGEKLKATTLSQRLDRQLVVAQCFYTTPI